MIAERTSDRRPGQARWSEVRDTLPFRQRYSHFGPESTVYLVRPVDCPWLSRRMGYGQADGKIAHWSCPSAVLCCAGRVDNNNTQYGRASPWPACLYALTHDLMPSKQSDAADREADGRDRPGSEPLGFARQRCQIEGSCKRNNLS